MVASKKIWLQHSCDIVDAMENECQIRCDYSMTMRLLSREDIIKVGVDAARL